MKPHGWEIRRLAELGHIQAGRQRSPHYTAGELRPYLRVANVLDGFIDTSQVYKMQFTDAEFGVFRLEPGDVLLNEGQSLELVGRSAIYQGDPPECCFQNTLIRFRPSGDIDSSFAQYLFQYLQYDRVFSRVALQTTSIAHLGVSRFGGISVPIPPIAEQCAIAERLDSLTEAVSLVQRLLALKQELRRALSSALLAGWDQVDAAKREKWKTVRLGELFTERAETSRSDLPLLSITGDRGVIPRTDIERRDSSNADKKKYKRIAQGDIGYNTMRMWQGVIAFTGTPVMKRDKSTIEKFGGLIAPSYTIRHAVDDKTVVPLLYEGRHAQQRVDQAAIDEWFERTTRALTPDQRADLKKKFAKPDRLFRAEPVVKAIAWDISEHFAKNFKGTAFKGQLVAPRKETAIQYKGVPRSVRKGAF